MSEDGWKKRAFALSSSSVYKVEKSVEKGNNGGGILFFFLAHSFMVGPRRR